MHWHLITAYGYLDSLGSAAFAWEFLRRNPGYRAAYESISNVDDAAMVTKRWGCATAADPDLRVDRARVVWAETAEKLQG
jgi:hypothetical protein